jgi:hypothetical protein
MGCQQIPHLQARFFCAMPRNHARCAHAMHRNAQMRRRHGDDDARALMVCDAQDGDATRDASSRCREGQWRRAACREAALRFRPGQREHRTSGRAAAETPTAAGVNRRPLHDGMPGDEA